MNIDKIMGFCWLMMSFIILFSAIPKEGYEAIVKLSGIISGTYGVYYLIKK